MNLVFFLMHWWVAAYGLWTAWTGYLRDYCTYFTKVCSYFTKIHKLCFQDSCCDFGCCLPKFYPFRVDPLSEGRQKQFWLLPPMEMYQFPQSTDVSMCLHNNASNMGHSLSKLAAINVLVYRVEELTSRLSSSMKWFRAEAKYVNFDITCASAASKSIFRLSVHWFFLLYVNSVSGHWRFWSDCLLDTACVK